jgi:hypothetical protein
MVMSIKHKVYHIIWNDASEGESHDDINSEECIQEAFGVLYKKDNYNYYIARDYNHLAGEYQKVLRIPRKYVIGEIKKIN